MNKILRNSDEEESECGGGGGGGGAGGGVGTPSNERFSQGFLTNYTYEPTHLEYNVPFFGDVSNVFKTCFFTIHLI